MNNNQTSDNENSIVLKTSVDKLTHDLMKEFEKNGGKLPDKIELDFSKDSNLNYSICHATLLNPKITDDGYIEGVIYDKYDYDYKYLNTPETTLYNAGAATLHEWDKLEYYYYFIPVRFKY